MGEAAVRVQIVDDHPLWRQTLRRLLERDGFAEVVAEASDGTEAVALSQANAPDVVVMDVVMPEKDGIESTRDLLADRPEAKVLVLASSEDRDQVLEAIRAGASGYLLKTAEADDVRDAVRRVHLGELVFPPPLSSLVLDQLRRSGADHTAGPRDASTNGGQPQPSTNSFVREGDYWTVAFGGQQIRLKDTKGARLLNELLHHPMQEFHALELTAAANGEGVGPSPGASSEGLHVSAMGGTGPVLDRKAKQAYRRRLGEIQQELDEASEWNDPERVARLQHELDALTSELSAATGLGGRDREGASNAERARVSTTLAIRRTLKKLAEHHPDLAEHLDATIRTGTYCSYEPDPGAPTTWS